MSRIRPARTLCAVFLALITITLLTGCHKGRGFVFVGSGYSSYGGHKHYHRPDPYCPPPPRHHHHHRGGRGHHGGYRY